MEQAAFGHVLGIDIIFFDYSRQQSPYYAMMTLLTCL